MHKYTIESAVFLNIMYIIIGIIMIRTEKDSKNISKIILGLIPVFLGTGTLLVGVIFDNSDFIMKISFLWLAVILWDVIAIKVINCRKWNYMVEAVYVDKKTYSGYRGAKSYGPVFRYTYNEVEYKSEAKQYFSENQMRLRFIPKKKYKIYICEKEPECCIVDKIDKSIMPILVVSIVFVI